MSMSASDASSRYPAPRAQSSGRPFTIASFVCAGLAVLFGLFAAVPGIILGIVGLTKGDRQLGGWAIGACIVGAVIGIALGVALLNSSESNTAALLL
jgi:uncharacterized membrane protein HdeD (DUF308 family)